MEPPDWLPPQLSLTGSSYQNDINSLYAVYERDFIKALPVVVDGYKVIVNNTIDKDWGDSKYTHGFTHVITRGKGYRGIDYERAQKLPWIKAILENYTQSEVTAFWYRQPKRESLYLWIQDYDFIVILTPIVGKFIASKEGAIIVSAYSVDSYRRYNFEQLLKKSYKVL